MFFWLSMLLILALGILAMWLFLDAGWDNTTYRIERVSQSVDASTGHSLLDSSEPQVPGTWSGS